MITKPNLIITLLDGGDLSRVTGNCLITGEEYSCTVSTVGLRAWLEGEYIQVALSDVSVDDREFLKSGISPAGWDKAFG